MSKTSRTSGALREFATYSSSEARRSRLFLYLRTVVGHLKFAICDDLEKYTTTKLAAFG